MAKFLGEKGKKVTLVEMLEEIVPAEFSDTKKYFDNIVAKYRIRVLTKSKILRIAKTLVTYELQSGEEETLKADGVVLALGNISNTISRELIPEEGRCEVYDIGDCVNPGKIIDAVYAAYRLAYSL
jgi:pyruvate/2-oxoglutarate dehydrogenase complex dihydrolipoamide dehydrogenase (E3) component